MITFFEAATIFLETKIFNIHKRFIGVLVTKYHLFQNVGKKLCKGELSRMQFIFTFLQIKVCALRMLQWPSDVAKKVANLKTAISRKKEEFYFQKTSQKRSQKKKGRMVNSWKHTSPLLPFPPGTNVTKCFLMWCKNNKAIFNVLERAHFYFLFFVTFCCAINTRK